MTTGSRLVSNKSESSFRSHTASQEASLAETYFALAVLRATDPYFLLDQETIAEPMLKQNTEVLFRSWTLPAQSESEKLWSDTPPPEVYLCP